MGAPQDSNGFSCVLQAVPLRIAMGFQRFSTGYPLGFQWISDCFARGALRISVDFQMFCKGVPLRISVDFNVFCKGYPLGFRWIAGWFAMGGPLGFQWISMCFARGTP